LSGHAGVAEEIIEAVKKMKKADREAFIEDLLAVTSPEYLQSVKEARAEYKAGKTKHIKKFLVDELQACLYSQG